MFCGSPLPTLLNVHDEGMATGWAAAGEHIRFTNPELFGWLTKYFK